MATTEKKTLSTLDLYLAAYFSLQKIPPKLKVQNGRVTFNFEVTDKLYEKALAFNSNEPVPVADFVTAVKTLRGQMLTMRGQR